MIDLNTNRAEDSCIGGYQDQCLISIFVNLLIKLIFNRAQLGIALIRRGITKIKRLPSDPQMQRVDIDLNDREEYPAQKVPA